MERTLTQQYQEVVLREERARCMDALMSRMIMCAVLAGLLLGLAIGFVMWR